MSSVCCNTQCILCRFDDGVAALPLSGRSPPHAYAGSTYTCAFLHHMIAAIICCLAHANFTYICHWLQDSTCTPLDVLMHHMVWPCIPMAVLCIPFLTSLHHVCILWKDVSFHSFLHAMMMARLLWMQRLAWGTLCVTRLNSFHGQT